MRQMRTLAAQCVDETDRLNLQQEIKKTFVFQSYY